jgi:N6-L-threonylcarbamoyladenine synthase
MIKDTKYSFSGNNPKISDDHSNTKAQRDSSTDTYILGIESSCDDTSAAVLKNNKILANIIANQDVHKHFGGVVPELASRAHQQNIIPVIQRALDVANVSKNQLHAVAFTNGPGLLGSLLVGASFAKSFSLALGIPLIEVNHMHAHIMALFIDDDAHPEKPEFPFLCLTVSGGHTQIVLINSHFEMKVIGQTIDDAAGEAFDKAAKIMGLPYPGGPLIDKFAREGNPLAIKFPHPNVPDLDFSFSGLKTSILYFLRDQLKANPDYIEQNKLDLCASVQHTIVEILMSKVKKAVKETGINRVAMAGGVSANSGLRNAFLQQKGSAGWKVYIPKFEYCTDNAAMIAITGYFKYQKGIFAEQTLTPFTRYNKTRNS